MGWLTWLQELGSDADGVAPGFQAQSMYLAVCVVLPVTVGLFVGFSLRLVERVLGVELGRGGH